MLNDKEKANWQEFRRESGRPFRNQQKSRPGKLLRIYSNYKKAGSIRMCSKRYGVGLNTVRKAIKYVETRELIEVQAVGTFCYLLTAQGVA